MSHALLHCTLPSSSVSYEIEVQNGLFTESSCEKALFVEYIASLAPRCALVTDENVASLYGEALQKTVCSNGLECFLFSFPQGERFKTRATKELLEDQMAEKRLGRDTVLIALGGGVVTDLGGYIAATYCRGLPLVMIPTSLVGMVDASIGGKTGVNIPSGKNRVGCIYQPKKVFIDPFFLHTLGQKERADGFAEMIKHALVADKSYFCFLEQHAGHRHDLHILERAIFESCRIKKEIVERDEHDMGIRTLLNFGHTIGHSLEQSTSYTMSHGEAVALGLLVESFISHSVGYLRASSLERIQKCILSYVSSFTLPKNISLQSLLENMHNDKKARQGKTRFVLLRDIGDPLSFHGEYCTAVDDALLVNALDWMKYDLCGCERPYV